MAHDSRLPVSLLPLAWAAVLATTGTMHAMRLAGVNVEEAALTLGFTSSWELSLLVYSIYQLATVLALLLAIRRLVPHGLAALGFRKPRGLRYYVYAVLLVPVASMIWFLCSIIVRSIGLSMWWTSRSMVAINSVQDLVVYVVSAVAICATMEEVMYRGYVLTALMQRVKSLVLAFTLDALVFSSIHYAFGPGVMLFIFLWTYIPCWLYTRSGSLYPPMVFHVSNNLLAYVVLPLLLR